MPVVFSKQRFDFAFQTTEQFKNIPKPEHSKKYVFLAKCIENVVLREKYCKQNQGKWARETITKFNTGYAEVNKKRTKTVTYATTWKPWQPHLSGI